MAGGNSVADFWVIDPYASYTACAYGEITGDFYGCIDGGIADFYNTVNFDLSGIPFKSEPSDEPAEWFVFDNSNQSSDFLFIGASSDGSGGCFIGSLTTE